ncbi:hypothetical protein [Nocardioides sp.]|uniref:hypothetical protein n=1 Tax=Nocardioides sp. TaxID=35761 RepID=UPI00272860CC|nr:hypothetical protein [Nocardioides sp.]MDO9456324.1 hypothetical protein [Nocardioides sp.]
MFAVAIVVCLVVLGVRYADTSGSFGDRVGQVFTGDDETAAEPTVDDTRTRELVASQANQFMIRINTYGPKDLDKSNKMPGYVERVKEMITPKLDVEFEKQVTLAEQSVAQAGLARTIQLYATGTDSIDTDLATVLVTGSISQSYPDPTKDGRIEYEPLLFRYEVRLVKTEGTWLVDDFTPVKGEVEGEPTDAPADPTAPSTVDPSSDPSSDPSGAASSGVVERYAEIVANRQDSLSVALDALSGCGFPTAAPADDAACAAAPAAVGDAARSLSNSLKGASNPDSKVFAGAPPAAIADLVSATQVAAANVDAAVVALDPTCVSGASADCATQRGAVAAASNNLVDALGGWAAIQ